MCFTYHHHQGSGNSFVGNISYDQYQMILIGHKEIIKVSSHFQSRIHYRIEVKILSVRESREFRGQLALLYSLCHIQLCT